MFGTQVPKVKVPLTFSYPSSPWQRVDDFTVFDSPLEIILHGTLSAASQSHQVKY